MGHTDRWCAALGNSNRVVSSDRLEGHAAADGIYGHTGLAFETVGAALGQFLRSRLRQWWVSRFGAVLRL
jgi:hypothetical protein